MQAVALRIAGDKAMFYGVRILGTQDTLLDDTGSHYFYQSYIEGTVDFIFGRARSLYRVLMEKFEMCGSFLINNVLSLTCVIHYIV